MVEKVIVSYTMLKQTQTKGEKMNKLEIFFITLFTLCLVVFMQGFIFGGLTISDFQDFFNQVINQYK